MKILIYVLYYDSTSFDYVSKNYNHMRYALKPIPLHSTKYLENILYLEYLPTHSSEWESHDYVGSLSYRFNQKLNTGTIHRFLKSTCTSDVVYFLDYGIRKNVINRAEMSHPGFRNAWILLLTKAGFDKKDILNDNIPFLACNYWVAKPEWMERYIQFQQKLVKIIADDPILQQKLDINAHYHGKITRTRLMMIFNRPYYTLHPFIFERLPGFFFNYYKASIQYFL